MSEEMPIYCGGVATISRKDLIKLLLDHEGEVRISLPPREKNGGYQMGWCTSFPIHPSVVIKELAGLSDPLYFNVHSSEKLVTIS